MKHNAQWVKGIVQHENYSLQDYARFQSELRRKKKTGLLEMMQRLLKQKNEQQPLNAIKN